MACGTGDLAALAAAAGARVVGVDFAPAMLARARGRGAALVRGDAARAAAARSACADAVTCGFALRNVVADPAVLAEAARVLRPGGRLVLLEVAAPRRAAAALGAPSLLRRASCRSSARLLADRQAYAYLPASTAYLPSEPALRALLEAPASPTSSADCSAAGSVQLVTARAERVAEAACMARGTTALAATRAAGFVHAEAAVSTSSDPLRLLRAFPSTRRFLWLQPATGHAIAGVGASVSLRARGARRFTELSATLADVLDGDPLPAGVVAVGGFAFDANARDRGPWRGFAPLEWTIPQMTLVRRAGRAHLVATAPPGTSAGSLASALARARVALDGPDTCPTPVASYHALGSHASTWRRAVEATLDDITAGRLEKLVLARTCTVRGVVPFDPWRVVARLSPRLSRLHHRSPSGAGARPSWAPRPSASPASTARGSTPPRVAGTAPRGANPRSDRDLARALHASPKERAEHGVVVATSARRLDPLCDEVVAAPQPDVARDRDPPASPDAHPRRLRPGAGLLEAVAALHPTAAICGAPRAAARAVLAAREGAARGWYAGGVGWLDAQRGRGGGRASARALLRGTHALLHAGAGIVAGSTWEAELEETRLKMRPLLGALAGAVMRRPEPHLPGCPRCSPTSSCGPASSTPA